MRKRKSIISALSDRLYTSIKNPECAASEIKSLTEAYTNLTGKAREVEPPKADNTLVVRFVGETEECAI